MGGKGRILGAGVLCHRFGEAAEELGDIWRYGLIEHDLRTDCFHLHDLPRELAEVRLMDSERAVAEGWRGRYAEEASMSGHSGPE